MTETSWASWFLPSRTQEQAYAFADLAVHSDKFVTKTHVKSTRIPLALVGYPTVYFVE